MLAKAAEQFLSQYLFRSLRVGEVDCLMRNSADVKKKIISIVAHLFSSQSWTKEWLLERAEETLSVYYRLHCYAVGLSVWNNDQTFIDGLNDCPKDSTGHDGKMFVRWAASGDWKRFRFHMGGWGPKM